MKNDRRDHPRGQTAGKERGAVAVLTAMLVVVLVGAMALALNHGYALLVQRELRTAADAAAHAVTVSLCATSACWADAKAAAINVLKGHLVHGRLGDSAAIDLDPDGGPVWEDARKNWRVTVERGRWLPGGRFASLELPKGSPQSVVPLRLAANAVRVEIERPKQTFIAYPYGAAGGSAADYELDARTTALKGKAEVGCVAPFALPVCALVHDGEFQTDALDGADRLFMRTSRFCDAASPGSPACKRLVPEFFYSPADPARYDPLTRPVEVSPPQCSWNNPRFTDPSDHFGVVGLPESAVATKPVGEDMVRQVLENTTRPCVPATLGEPFLVLGTGLTEQASGEALWRQISVDYGGPGRSHPAFSAAYPKLAVSTKSHDPAACPAAAGTGGNGWGACNSRRYVYNGVLGQTYFPAGRFDHGFTPAWTDGGITWPAANEDTPLWKVQVPIIGPRGSKTLDCPGGTSAGAEDPWVDPGQDYEIVGFLMVNLFDEDIAAPPPLNPSQIADDHGWGPSGSDRVWGLNRAPDGNPTGPTCYPPGDKANSPECAPCDVVRGRVAENADYVATDQAAEPLVSLVFDRGGGLKCECLNVTSSPPPTRCNEWRNADGVACGFVDHDICSDQLGCEASEQYP